MFIRLYIHAENEKEVRLVLEELELSEEQLILLASLYERKIQPSQAKIILSKQEIHMLGTTDSEGLKESRQCFEELNIHWDM
jgi:hypothetical protein